MDRFDRILRQQCQLPLSRKSFLRLLAASGAIGLLAACGGAADSSTTATSSTSSSGSGSSGGTTPATAARRATPAGGAASTTGSPVAANGQKGGRAVFATKVAEPNLDPHMEISDARMRRSPLIYDTLVEWQNDLSIGPGLAESFDTNGTKWVFRLRKGTQFSNGKEVRAEDVVYSIQRVLDSPGKAFYSTIATASAPDPYTVELDLSATSAPLLAALGGRYAFIIPKDGDKQVDLKQTSLGSGAFKVKEFVQNQRLVLEKNPNSWQADKVYLDELEIRIIPDEPTIVAGLRSGEVDMAVFEDSKNYALTSKDSTLVTRRDPAIRWDILDFPCLDTAPYSNVKVRQAISAALDRPAIISAAISNLGTLLGGHPPALWGALPPEQNPFFKRDVAKAKQLLQEAGVSTPLQLTLYSIVGYSTLTAAAQVIVENLKDIGMQVKIEQLDLGIWINNLNERKFTSASMNSWGGYVDPDLLYYNHLHRPPQGKDFRKWNNDKISALLDKGRTTLDHDQRVSIYNNVQRMYMEQCPWIPLYSADIISAHTQKVQNFTQHPSGYYQNLRYVWLKQ